MAPTKNEGSGMTQTITDDIIKDQVRDVLRSRKVKLWKAPYYKNDEINVSALKDLAKELIPQITIILNRDGYDVDLPIDTIYQALHGWQLHALENLKSKKTKNNNRHCPKEQLVYQLWALQRIVMKVQKKISMR